MLSQLFVLERPLRKFAQLPVEPVEETETQSSMEDLSTVAGFLSVGANPMLVETMALILSRAADTAGSR